MGHAAQVKESVQRCHPGTDFHSDILRVIESSVAWLEYMVVVGMVANLGSTFLAVGGSVVRSREGRYMHDNDTPPYWCKLVRATCACIAFYAAVGTHVVAWYGNIDTLMNVMSGCSDEMSTSFSHMRWFVWAALVCTVMCTAWGTLWAFLSVSVFTLVSGKLPVRQD